MKIELEGMKGLSSLGANERDAYKRNNYYRIKNPEKMTVSQLDAYYEQMYKNDKFVERFGIDKFYSMPKQERDSLYEESIVKEAWLDSYGNTPEMGNFDELKQISSVKAMRFLLENDYKTPSQIQEEHERELNERLIIPMGNVETAADTKRSDEMYLKYKETQSKGLLEDAVQIDRQELKDAAFDYKNLILNDALRKIQEDPSYIEEVNKEFKDLLSTKIDNNPLFPYYAAYKDSYQLAPENVNVYKQLEWLSQYNAIQALAAQEKDPKKQEEIFIKNISILNDEIQHTVHENSSGWDKFVNSSKGIATKTVSSLGQTLTGAIALGLAVTDQEHFENFIQGKDENGEDLPLWKNMQYFSDMDTFNKWSRAEQLNARNNGGLSTAVNVRDVGEEHEWLTSESFLDAYSMLGYTASSLGLDYMLLGGGKLLRGTATTAVKAMLKSGINKNVVRGVTNILNSNALKYLGELSRMQIHSVSESSLEASNIATELIEQRKKDKEFYMNSPETQYKINSYVNTMLNNEMYRNQTFGKTYEDLYKEAYNAISDKYDENTEDAAARAFMVEATTKQLKNSIGDNIYKKYMYAKPLNLRFKGKQIDINDVDFIEGKPIRKKLTVSKGLGIAAKTIGGGFFDEASDELLNKGAMGLGISLANDYDSNMFSPEAYSTMSGILTGTMAWIDGAEDALFDPSTYQQGFIGAMSPIVSTSPNFTGIAQTTLSKKQREAFKKLSGWEKANTLIFNPLVKEIATLKQEIREDQEYLDVVNDIISKHGEDFKDIVYGITTVQNMMDSKDSNSKLDSADSEDDMAFQFIRHLQKLGSAREILPLVDLYMQNLQNAAEGNASQEDITAFLNTPENSSLVSELGREKAEQLARETLQKNAKKLESFISEFQKNQNFIDTYFGDNLEEVTKDRLSYLMFKDKAFKGRLEDMERKISYKKSPTEAIVFGQRSKTRVKRDIEAYEKNLQFIDSVLESENIEKLTKKKLKARKAELIKLLDSTRKELEQESNILMADQIINAHPDVREDMLLRSEDYTVGQQVEIEKAKVKLLERDPDYKNTVRDIKTINYRVKDFEESFNSLIENIDAFDEYSKIQQMETIVNGALKEQQLEAEKAENILSNLPRMLDTITPEAVKYHSSILKRVIDNNEELAPYLRDALSKVEYQESALAIINEDTQLSPEQKGTVLSFIKNLIDKTTSVTEARDVLEKEIDKENGNEFLAEYINNILDKLESLGYTRNATTLENREKLKKEREIKKQEEEQKRLEEERQKDGSNFGWEGYKVGDPVYKTSDGKQGTILEFKDNSAVVSFEGGEKTIFDNIKALSKEPPFGKDVEVKGSTEVLIDDEESSETPPETPTNDNNPLVQEASEASHKQVDAVQREEEQQHKTDTDALLGNTFYEYDVQQLKGENSFQKRASRRKATKETLSRLFEFFDINQIKYQKIVDTVVPKIFRTLPDTKVYFMMRRQESSVKEEDPLQTIIFNVVEYTDEIKKLHDESLGGVIESNGKKYLIIGTLGYAKTEGNTAPWDNFIAIKKPLEIERYKNLKDSKEEFYVSPNFYTKIKHVDTGRLTHTLSGQEDTKFRSISSLLADPESNPNGYTMSSLGWRIQKSEGAKEVNTNSADSLVPNREERNKGAVFVMVKTGNNKNIPIKIRPTTISELEEDSALKDHILQIIGKFNSDKYDDRKEALEKFREFVYTSREGKNIDIGSETNNEIVIYDEGVATHKFNLESNFSLPEFINAIMSTGFRVNITEDTLSSEYLLNMYDEAGALTTDVAVLGTVNLSYSVYPVSSNGTPILSEEAPKNNLAPKSNSEFIQKNNYAVTISGTVYRELPNGSWEDDKHKTVTDKNIIFQLTTHKKIEVENLQPINIGGYNYYILDKDNFVVVKKLSKNRLAVLEKSIAEDIINKNTEELIKKEKQERAKQEVKNSTSNSLNADIVSLEEVNTEDPIDANLGIVEKKQEEKPITKEEPSKKIVTEVENPNKLIDKSLEELSKQKEILTFVDIYRDSKHREALKEVFKEKGWEFPRNARSLETVLRAKNIATENISDVQTWLQIIKDCR